MSEPYIAKVSEIKMEKVEDMGEGVWIQWLIHKGVGAKRYAMRRFVVKRQGKIKRHSHPWEHEIYVLSGSGIVGVGDKEYRLSEDMVAYIPPNVPHWYVNDSDEDWIFLCIIPYLEE